MSAQMHETYRDDPLFESVYSALMFAYAYSTQASPAPTPVAKLIRGPVGSGKGLVGLDGAAQAGMIRAEVRKVGPVAEAIIIARIAPTSTPCSCKAPCCSGWRVNPEWREAVGILADYLRTTALHGCTANGIMRREYVVRHFARGGDRMSLEKLADRHEINRQTIGAHAGKVAKMLRTLEHAAEEAVLERMKVAGLV